MYNYHIDVIENYGFDGKNIHIPLFTSIFQIVNTVAIIVILVKVF